MSNNILKSVIFFIGLVISLAVLVIGVFSLRSIFSKASVNTTPSNMRTGNITANSASVLWDTQDNSQGIVRYSNDRGAFTSGAGASLLFAAESAAQTSHEVKLSSLKTNTSYYYEISIKDVLFDQNGKVENNQHLPFSFTTTQSSTQGEDTMPNLDADKFKQKFGTTDAVYDLNKDGTVNATDYLIYLSRTSNPNP